MFELKAIEEMHNLTWDELVALEPRLEALLSDAKATRPQGKRRRGFNWEVEWCYFKQPIASTVGLFRRDDCDPRLKTVAAYDVVYWKLWHTLHD